MPNYKFNMPTIIEKLINDSFSPLTKMDKREELADFCGYANDFRINTLIKQKDVLFLTARKILMFFGYGLFATDEKVYEIDSVSTVIRIIKEILKEQNLSNVKYAEKLGITENALYKYFKQPNIKMGTVIKMFNALEHEVIARSDADKCEYILGFDTVYDVNFENNYAKFSTETIELTKTHNDFFEEFLEQTVEFDYESKIKCSSLYDRYFLFWEYNRALQPAVRSSNRKKAKTNAYGMLGKKEFKSLCIKKNGD